MSVAVIVTAGGTGVRFGGSTPKQFASLDGIPVLARTLAVFEQISRVTEMIVTVPNGYEDFTKKTILEAYGITKVTAVITGGGDRQASVYKALLALNTGTQIVLIHDGVRPFVKENAVMEIIACVEQGYAAIAGTKMTDTVKIANRDGLVTATPDRDTLWCVQTPQGFTYESIIRAHEMAAADGFRGTDDGVLVERAGLAPVMMVEGGRHNIKITTPEDIIIGESLFRMKS